MINANFSGVPSGVALKLSTNAWQYDTGQTLCVSGLSGINASTEVHFERKLRGDAVVKTGEYDSENNTLTVDIPDVFFEYADGTPGRVWIYPRMSDNEGKIIMTGENAGDKPRRVLLKLSGEAFGGGKVGIDTHVVRRIASEIVPAVDKGVQVAIVVGGGNFFRGAELQQAGIDRSRGDYMGMLGTVMNCLALQDFLEQEGQATRVQTAITMGQVAEPYIPLKAIRHLEKGRVVIFGAGAGMPYFSTDTVSIQRSLEIHCDEVLMGKNGVDGVYTADPRKDENAKRFEALSYNRALVDNLAVMDAAALSMARDNKKRIRVFGLEGEGNVTRALVGEEIGTLVSTAESRVAD